MFPLFIAYTVALYNTANFSIDPIPSKYRAGIANTNTDTDTLNL